MGIAHNGDGCREFGLPRSGESFCREDETHMGRKTKDMIAGVGPNQYIVSF